MIGRARSTIGRVLEDPDRPQQSLAHVQAALRRATLEQDRYPLTTQRMERMRYDKRVTANVGVTRTMRTPSTRSTTAPITSS